MVITFLNLKGGCGKTTLSIHAASTLALAGKKVLLVDADHQMSSMHWSENREKEPLFALAALPSENAHKQINILKKDYDFVIIDGPPHTSSISRSCIIASDLVLIPITPSPYDVWAANEIIDLLHNVKHSISEYKDIKSGIVINRAIHNANITKDVESALKEYNIKIFDTIIRQKVAYAESAAAGTSVIEEDPNSAAGEDIKKLIEEIIAFAGIKNKR